MSFCLLLVGTYTRRSVHYILERANVCATKTEHRSRKKGIVETKWRGIQVTGITRIEQLLRFFSSIRSYTYCTYIKNRLVGYAFMRTQLYRSRGITGRKNVVEE